MLNLNELRNEQLKLAKKVEVKDALKESDIKLIGGCDQAFFKDNVVSVVVVLNYKMTDEFKICSDSMTKNSPAILFTAQ